MGKFNKAVHSSSSGYDKVLDYLEEENGDFLTEDYWVIEKMFEYPQAGTSRRKKFHFNSLANERIRNEVKYYYVYSIAEGSKSITTLHSATAPAVRQLAKYLRNHEMESVTEIDLARLRFFLLNQGIKGNMANIYEREIGTIINRIKELYDDREETLKDIWHVRNIPGAIISATLSRSSQRLDFTVIPLYYQEMVKRYLRTIITKKSFKHCRTILQTIEEFFQVFYQMEYTDGFLEVLNREDVEKYLRLISGLHEGHNATYMNKFISYPRTFLEYIQMAKYMGAPRREISFLIFQDDIPRRERDADRLRRLKFIPEPVMQQIDGNIGELKEEEHLLLYILLRETGWRGADILNLRFSNCLEKIWNSSEERYNGYLCGEITKTGIALLKVPIRDKVAEMLEKKIQMVQTVSTVENNPRGYLFNSWTGKGKGEPIRKSTLVNAIQHLIDEKEISDSDGKIHHFRLHALRHTRAREYVEQGLGISIIQQLLGHQSLQMTIHYTTVAENVLYEKWKITEHLELFKLNHTKGKDRNPEAAENEKLIHYEYVKQNLDAVAVPFGICFKVSKMPCRQQSSHCIKCASFCTTKENLKEYETEINRVNELLKTVENTGRQQWCKKNSDYLELLLETKEKIEKDGIIHKNGGCREEQ